MEHEAVAHRLSTLERRVRALETAIFDAVPRPSLAPGTAHPPAPVPGDEPSCVPGHEHPPAAAHMVATVFEHTPALIAEAEPQSLPDPVAEPADAPAARAATAPAAVRQRAVAGNGQATANTPPPPSPVPPPMPGDHLEALRLARELHQSRSTPTATGPAPRPTQSHKAAPARPAQGTSSPTAHQSVLPYAPKPAPAAAIQEGAWEQTIGLKVAGWVGALVLIIGAGLGVKYGYERWVVNLPAELRLSMLALFGFALLGAGEWVYRRVHVWSAVGCFGAGVATLFLVAYAGHGYFDLYSRDVAFILMGIATLIGSAVAMRGRMASIAVLSIIGGNLAPFILGGDSSRIVEFLGYILMLQVTALVLVIWGRTSRWWSVRWLSLVTTGLWALQMLFQANSGRIDPTAPFVFSLIYGALFLIELAISSLRGSSDHRLAEQAVPFSVIVSAGLIGATLLALHDSHPMTRGAWILVCAAFEAALGWFLLLRSRRLGAGAEAADAQTTLRRRDAMALSLALRLQAAALVVIAVPVALAGPAVTLAWGILALVFAAIGWRLDQQPSRLAGVLTWILAVGYMPWAMNAGDPARAELMTRHAMEILGQPIPIYVLLAAVMALFGQALAWMVAAPRRADETPDADRQSGSVLLSILASSVWLVAAISGLEAIAATIAIVLYAWLLCGLDVIAPRQRLAMQALVLLAFTTAKWLFVDLLAARIGHGWSGPQLNYTPLLNPLMGMGVLLGGSMLAIGYLRRSRLASIVRSEVGNRVGMFGLGSVVLVFMTLALTLEIDRAVTASAAAGAWIGIGDSSQIKLLCWTMLWSSATVGLGALAWYTTADPQRRCRRLRALGVLPILLTIKHIFIDTLSSRLMVWSLPGTPFLNMEALASLFVVGTLFGGWWLIRQTQAAPRSRMAGTLGFAAMLLVLFTGTLELDRAFTQMFGAGALAKQVAWSIWWSSFAVICVTGGFLWRLAPMRYFGLGLFAVTLAKVFIIDLHNVSGGWRTLSFIGLGLLLMGTSVLYGRYSPKLLAVARAG